MHFTPFAFMSTPTPNVPLGGIVAVANAQAWSLPSSGQVKDGWALCNGQTFASLGVGNYDSSFTGNLPQLSDSRFVMGGSSIGAAGGANSIKLVDTNIPTLTSTDNNLDHSHSPVGSTHGNTAAHNHGPSDVMTTPNTNHTHTTSRSLNGRNSTRMYAPASYLEGDSIVTGPNNTTHTHGGTSNPPSQEHSHGIDTTTDYDPSPHTHTAGYPPSSQSSVTNIPKYIQCVYVMRVS